jgi:hypothetical protein
MTGVFFLAAVLGTAAVLGIPVAVHPSVKNFSPAAKVALAWSMGTVILTITLTILSAAGLKWTPWWVLPACLAVLAVAWKMIHASSALDNVHERPTRFEWSFRSLCFGLVAGGGLFACIFGFATSADLSYFWGVKAVHFALNRGVDFELLRQPYMIHLHPNYPPLWPVLLAWGALIAKSLPWLVLPSLTWICLMAAAAVIHSILDSKLDRRSASVITCLWLAVIVTMTVWSFSGGNADGPLVMFLSIALAVILTEGRAGPRPLRWLAALALAGAVFTKSEGMVATSFIVIGAAVRDAVWRRPKASRRAALLAAPAAATVVLWVVVRMANGIPLSDPIRETAFGISLDHVGVIARVCLRLLVSPVVAVGWSVPLVAALVVGGKGLVRSLPGVVTTLGMIAFAGAYYLHAAGNPLQLIVWTFPRLIQSAMSAWILGLGVAAFSVVNAGEGTTFRNQGAAS